VERAATSSAGVPSKTIRPPSWSGPGAEVDDRVGVRHDRLVVRDDDHRLARVDEPVKQAEQLLDVGEAAEDGVRGRSLRLAGTEELLGLGHRHREHLASETSQNTCPVRSADIFDYSGSTLDLVSH
jgi:hypothetical protein